MQKSLLFGLVLTLCSGLAAAQSHVNRPIRFAVIGDYGESSRPEQEVAALVHKWEPDFIITVGDNNYPLGEASTIDRNIGKYYHDYIHFDRKYNGRYKDKGSLINRFFPSLGNHDWYTDNARAHFEYFELPGNERYYSQDFGSVEIFALDSDIHEPDGIISISKQGQWLEEALARSTARWKVVYMHHPPYSSGKHGSSLWMQWPFKDWGASIVIAGHDHVYERIVVNQLTYIVCGISGSDLVPFTRTLPPIGSTEDVRYDKNFGAMLVEADDASFELSLYNIKDKLIDQAVLQ